MSHLQRHIDRAAEEVRQHPAYLHAHLPPVGEPCSYNGDAVRVKGQVRTHVSLLGANFFKEVRGMVYLVGASGMYRITLDDFLATGTWDR